MPPSISRIARLSPRPPVFAAPALAQRLVTWLRSCSTHLSGWSAPRDSPLRSGGMPSSTLASGTGVCSLSVSGITPSKSSRTPRRMTRCLAWGIPYRSAWITDPRISPLPNSVRFTGEYILYWWARSFLQIRYQFVNDTRTLEELEALTGRQWLARNRSVAVHTYAVRRWDDLRGAGGRRLKNVRDLVGLLSAAAEIEHR